MKKGRIISVVVCLSILFLLDTSYATLTDNLDGTVTQVRNDGSILMWTKDADMAGMVTWSEANSFIAYLNDINYARYSDWRLPVSLPLSEMSYLFYIELGNTADLPRSSGPFVNIVNLNNPAAAVQDGWYWSSTDDAGGGYDKLGFNFGLGREYGGYIPGEGDHAWAVRSAGVVPEPISSILFITGGAVLAGRRWLKRKRN